MTKRVKVSELPEFDAAEYLNSEEDVAAYLTTVLEENDPALLAAAIGDIGVIVLSVRNDTVVPGISFEINDLRIQFVRIKPKFVSPCRITTFRPRAHRFAR